MILLSLSGKTYMQYIDKHLIIERYINGSMSPTEVQNFHTMLETDGELRSMFRAENLLNSTINRDKVALEAADHSRMYATFLKNLADSIPQAATASAATGTAGAASWLARLGTSSKVAISTALLAGGVAAVIALYPFSPEQTTVPAPQLVAPAVSTPALSPDAAVQQTPRAKQPAGGSVSNQAHTGRTEEKVLPTASKPAHNAKTESNRDDIPEINKETVNVQVQAERK